MSDQSRSDTTATAMMRTVETSGTMFKADEPVVLILKADESAVDLAINTWHINY